MPRPRARRFLGSPSLAACNNSGKSFKISRTVMRGCFEEYCALMSMDTKKDEGFASSMSLVMAQVNAFVCSPISDGVKKFGVIYFDSTSVGRPFSQEDIFLVMIVARQLGVTFGRRGIPTVT